MVALPSSLTWRFLFTAVGISSCISLLWFFREGSIPLRYESIVHYSAVGRDRPLVLYAYAESESARENLQFFLAQGIHGAADFIFIFNGETDAKDLVPTSHDNIRVVQRDNTCFDLGSMGEVLRQDDLWKKYKRFITMNASIRGPFLPIYDSSTCWTDVFLGRLTDRVKMVGTTINCEPAPHLQSMLWAMDEVGMSILLDPALAHSVPVKDGWGSEDTPVGMSFCHETMLQAVHTEIGSTRLILSQGYEVDALMTAYASSNSTQDYCEHGQFEDVLYNDRYYGTNVHPYELVFIKSNRNIDPTLLAKMTEWHLGSGISSWDSCKAL
ncbi:hypothetical protein VPNG_04283 [Cytospora leucostoma]|uniref:Uncharacterized protein n=1 Tax=Cytospora leucostoma TaxID=1230097 RepID=A0A423XDM6_9PEZI|nr:hypothetical protein VPNG_04283 [Cytospora leucostoma]